MRVPQPSDLILSKLEELFGPDARQIASLLSAIDVAGQSPDRVHASILITSRGDRSRLSDALRLAELDWRDVLLGAGLGEEDWPNVLADYLASS